MLYMFTMAFKCFSGIFCKCFQTHILSVSYVFFYMLQLLHLNVLKIDRVLHMGCAWKVAGGAGDVRGGTGPLLGRSLASATR